MYTIMNILILRSGGREHAICKSLLYDKVKLYCIELKQVIHLLNH